MVQYAESNLSLAPPATQSSQGADESLSLTQESLATGPPAVSGMPLCPLTCLPGTQDFLATTLHTAVCMCSIGQPLAGGG